MIAKDALAFVFKLSHESVNQMLHIDMKVRNISCPVISHNLIYFYGGRLWFNIWERLFMVLKFSMRTGKRKRLDEEKVRKEIWENKIACQFIFCQFTALSLGLLIFLYYYVYGLLQYARIYTSSKVISVLVLFFCMLWGRTIQYLAWPVLPIFYLSIEAQGSGLPLGEYLLNSQNEWSESSLQQLSRFIRSI